MRDFEESTLWRMSAYERVRGQMDAQAAISGQSTMLPSTLMAELERIQSHPASDDVLEIIAACVRQREPALLMMRMDPFVWAVTLFPQQHLYHSPQEVAELEQRAGLAKLTLLSAERPGVRPFGHVLQERVAAPEKYHPLDELLWAMALHGPRATLLTEIGGRAAYRVAPGRSDDLPPLRGALGPAVVRLRGETASLREMSRWPGLGLERASRLLNGLYLSGSLMVTRSHPAAREEPQPGWLNRRR